MPFAKEGRPGGEAEAEAEAEEERRKEEARQRAEAEQAALEQLKEENPEAYAKPEPEDGEEGEGEGRRGSDEDEAESRPARRIQRMAKTSQKVEAGPQGQVQDARVQPLPPLRAAARLLPQVRPLPDLPARGRARGLHPRHDQVELVEETRC